jgi:hypothetical protein
VEPVLEPALTKALFVTEGCFELYGPLTGCFDPLIASPIASMTVPTFFLLMPITPSHAPAMMSSSGRQIPNRRARVMC